MSATHLPISDKFKNRLGSRLRRAPEATGATAWRPGRVRVSAAAAAAFAFLGLLCSCGGGGGTNSTSSAPPPPPAPDFALVVQNTSITLQQQGAAENEVIGINALNGFTGTVSLTLQGLPAGVTATPAGPYSYTVGGSLQGVSFGLSASSAAAVGTSTVTVTGASGTLSQSASFPVQVTAQAPFAIQVSPTSLSLTPGSVGTVQISVTVSSGTSPSLTTNISNLPNESGLTLMSPQGVLTPSNPVSFSVVATAVAQPLSNFPIVVTAQDSSNNTSSVTVPLNVSVPFSSSTTPTRTTFARTDSNPNDAVYDATRKLVFVTLEGLNEVVVLSSTDGHRVATIPAELPVGIDETPDGSEVLVGSQSPFLTIINPNTLQVVARVPGPVPASHPTTVSYDYPEYVAALSNGDALLLAEEPFQLVWHIYLWNPTTGAMTLEDQTGFSAQGMQRSADYSTVLFSGVSSAGQAAELYTAATDTFTGPAAMPGPGQFAISPDGSQIVAVGGQNQPTILYNNQFSPVASINLGTDSTSGAIYSLDGSRVYVAASFGFPAVAVLDATNASLLGVVPDFQVNGVMNAETPLAIDETGMLFDGGMDGLALLDVSSPGFFKLPTPGPFDVQPSLLSLSSATQAQLSGAGFSSNDSYNVYFGAPPASPNTLQASSVSYQSSQSLNLTAPKGTASGTVDVTLTRSDGWFEDMPDTASYGPQVLFIDTNAGPTSGGSTVWIYGYGFPSSGTTVTIGGNPATITQVLQPGFLSPFPFPMDLLQLTTSPGNAGPADVEVSTPSGSTTVAGGFQYLASAQVFPVAGALDDIIYDQPRQRLYVTNQDHNQVDVFDLGSSSFLTPIPVGNQPTGLALTPDGSLLAVINSGDGTVSVIDPTKMQVTATYPVVTTADEDPNTCGGVAFNVAPVEPHRMLVDVDCKDALVGGVIHLLDLDTGSLSCTGVAGCDSTGVNIAFDSGLVAMASTPDGSEVLLTDISQISGQPVGLLNFVTNTLTTAPDEVAHDAAVDADANLFMDGFYVRNAGLDPVSVLGDVPYYDAAGDSFNNLTSEKLNPSGSLLFLPQGLPVSGNGVGEGMDIFDVHTGRLAMRVALPEPLQPCLNSIALDETGTKMFLISQSGITIAQLAAAPLSIATVNPSSAGAGAQVTIRGSGFANGATVTFGTTNEPTTFVDGQTLQATVPNLPAGSVRVTVTNPDGKFYSFDDAFSVN